MKHVFNVILIILLFLGSRAGAETAQIMQEELANGLTSYVIQNKNQISNNEVSLTLLIKAGSLQEHDDELGYAHFVEHMAFNGTRDFPKDKLREEMSRMGLKLGNHSNAQTAFDYTLYRIHLNTVESEKLERSLALMAQWAMHISFDEDEVELEKGILHEEWRLRQPDRARATYKLREALYKDSRLADRIPGGTQESIDTATSKRLRAFYQRWYRPDNAAIIVSGDIDPDWVKQKIQEQFADWESGEERLQPQVSNLNLSAIIDELQLSDSNVLGSQISLAFLQEENRSQTLQQQIDRLPRRLALGILNRRLDKERVQTAGKVSQLRASWMQYTPQRLYTGIDASLVAADYEVGMEILSRELAHFQKKGVDQQELNTVKASLLKNSENYLESSASLSRSTVNHFLYGTPLIAHQNGSAIRICLYGHA